MSRKWTLEYLRNGFVDEIKQKRAEQGYNTDEKPTHKWLRQNSFGYFLQRVRELNKRPDEWLLNECGFEPQQKDYPCENPETIRHIEGWLEYEDNVSERFNGVTIGTARTHIRRSMEIAKETIGTSDIFELGRGDYGACVNRGRQLMRGFRHAYDNEQTRLNYVTTIRDLLTEMVADGVIDHNPLEHLVKTCRWSGSSSSKTIAPSPSLVKKYIDACETRTEQMVMICLVVMGWRPSDFCDPESIQKFYLDSSQPYVEFADGRKNGASFVPIVLCQDFIEQWVRLVETVPGNDTALFPSAASNDGGRSTQWVRNTVSDIGERVDGTLRNGEKPTPNDFRNFWHTEYVKAFSQYRRDNDFAASAQGTQSSRIPMESYTDPTASGWFKTFEEFAKPQLSVPVADLEPADEIGNIDIGDIDGDAMFDVVETARQATLEGWNSSKALCPTGAAAYLSVGVGVVAGHTAATWGRIKHHGMELHPDWKYYPQMPLHRQAGLGLVLGLLLTVVLGSWYMDGTFERLASGEVTAWIPIVIAGIYAMWLLDRQLPEPADAVESLE